MKMKKYALMALAAITFVACKKNNNNESIGAVGQGKDTKLQLTVTAPKAMTTYAAGDENATDAEIKINRLDVFIYDDGAPFGLVSHTQITGDSSIYENGSSTIKKQTVNAKTGSKQVFVGVNLSPVIVAKLAANYANMNTAIDVDMNTLVNSDGSVAMFNERITRVNVTENAATNIITVPVSRLVAKASVRSGQNLVLTGIAGGSLSDLNYSVGQANTKQFIAPLINFRDPNWLASSLTANDLSLVRTADFQAVNAYAVANLNQNKHYFPENTSNEHRFNQVTYLSIRARFVPTTLTGTSPITNGTFYAVFTNAGVYYFGGLAEAQAYATANNGAAPIIYTNGYAYYRLYLNPEGGTVGEGRYDVLRNVYYHATITRINGLGTPGENQIDGQPGTPGNPGSPVEPSNPLNPTDPIRPATRVNIEATINIVPWTMHIADYEI